MADEEVKAEIAEVEPQPEAEVPAEPAQEELPLAAAEEAPKAEAAPEQPKPEDKPPENKLPTWADKELKKKHAQIKEFQRQLAEKDAELEAAKALAGRTNEQPREPDGKFAPVPRADVVPVSEVDKRAQQIVAKQQYDADCNKAAQAGEQRYKADWRGAIGNLDTLGGFDQDTMNGILATDDPAKVLYELGSNPEHYHRIMELPVPRRIIEMGKIAMTQTAPKQVSQAPAPVAPVGGRAGAPPAVLDDKLDDDKWNSIRDSQRLKRYQERNGIRR